MACTEKVRLVLGNYSKKIKATLKHDEQMIYTRNGEAFKVLSNGEQKNINMVVKTIYRVLTPNRSLRGVLKSKKSPLNFEGILHCLSENNFKVIKLIWT